MEPRPKMNIQLTRLDKTLEIVCFSLLLLTWIAIIAFFSNMPNQVPEHFNAAGSTDGAGDKKYIFILPGIATIIYLGMTWLNKHPHLYNYAPGVTAENAKRFYTPATKLIRILKLAVVVILSGIMIITFQTAFTGRSDSHPWLLPAAIALMIIPNIIYFIRTSQL